MNYSSKRLEKWLTSKTSLAEDLNNFSVILNGMESKLICILLKIEMYIINDYVNGNVFI